MTPISRPIDWLKTLQAIEAEQPHIRKGNHEGSQLPDSWRLLQEVLDADGRKNAPGTTTDAVREAQAFGRLIYC